MATKDFRASQVRLSQIIGSGSDVGNKPSILIVSASDSSGFEGEALSNSNLLSKVGSDVFLFVTGSVNTRDAVTLFGGDVVISGTMYAERQVVEVDLSATGSLSVSGSLIVSQSATIYEGLVVNETGETGPENDLRVETGNKTHALFVDASKDQVLILSGGNEVSTDEAAGNDVAFFVSGTVDNKNSTSVRGTSVFGGDTVVSGTFYTEKIQSRTNQGSTNDTYIDVGASTSDTLKFYAASAEEVRINAAGLHVADAILHIGDDDTNIQFGDDQILLQAGGKPGLRITESATGADRIDIGGNNSLAARFDQVLIMSGGHTSSPTEGSYDDTNFFVSGTIGSRDSASVRGTALFGGDLVVSGALVAKNGSVSGGSISGSIHHTAGGLSYLVAGSNISIVSGSNGQVTITSTGGGDGTVTSGSFNEVSITGKPNSFVTTASLSLAGEKGFNYGVNGVGYDVFFFVSGTTGLPEGAYNAHKAVLGGDSVVSGVLDLKSNSLHSGSLLLGHSSTVTNSTTPNTNYAFGGSAGGAGLQLNLAATSRASSEIRIQDKAAALAIGYISQSQANDRDGAAANTRHLVLKPGSSTAGIRLEGFGSGGGLTKSSLTVFDHSALIMTGGLPAKALDTSFYVSGSVGSYQSNSDRGTSVFGGDLVVSGNLYASGNVNVAGDKKLSVGHIQALGGYHGTGSINIDGTLGPVTITSKINPSSHTNGAGILLTTVAGAGTEAGAIWIEPGRGNGLDTVRPGKLILRGGQGGDATALDNPARDGQHIYIEGGSPGEPGDAGSNGGSGGNIYILSVSGSSGGNDGVGDGGSGGNAGNIILSASHGGSGTGDGSGGDGGSIILSASNGGTKSGSGTDGSAGDIRLHVHQGSGRVLIMSGGAASSFDEASGSDVNFYVSGTVGSLGSTVRGTSVFGGDTKISGSLVVASGISGSLTHLADGSSYLVAGSNITIATGSSGAVTITAAGGGSGEWTDGGDFIYPSDGNGESVVIGGNSVGTADIYLKSDGSAVFNEQGAAVDFRVESDTKTHALFVDGSTDQVLVLSGGNSASANEAASGDVAFYVSGTIGSQGTTTRGTALFGGDAYFSGSIRTEKPVSIAHDSTSTDALLITTNDAGSDAAPIISLKRNSSSPAAADYLGQIKFKGENDADEEIVYAKITGKIEDKSDGSEDGIIEYAVKSAGSNSIVARIKNDGLALAEGISHIGESSNKINFDTGQVLILSGGSSTSLDEAAGADVNFFVSGTIGGKNGSSRGVSVFGGDLCSSGSVFASTVNATTVGGAALSGSLTRLTDGSSYLIAGSNVTIASGSNGSVTIASADTNTEYTAGDGLDLSGTTFSTDLKSGGGLKIESTELAIDNSVVATLTGSTFSGAVTAPALSGSLTHLSDGKSYLVAGANITISTGSTGNVTIASTGGGDVSISGTPANNQISIWTDATTIEGDAALTYNGVTINLDDAVTINESGDSASDFRVESQNKTHSLFVDASTDQVLILSGGASTSYNEAAASDVGFYVSGTIGAKDGTTRGASLFGGDVVVSGALHGKNIHVGEYIYHSDDTDSNTFIQLAEDSIGITAGGEQLITISEAGQDIVKIGDGGDVDFQVRTDGDDNTLYVQGSSNRVGIGTDSPASVLHIKESAPTLSLQRESNSNNSTVAFLGSGGHTGAIMHLSSSNDLVFKTHDGTSPHEIMRLGGHYAADVRQVILLSGSDMHASAMQPKNSADINFFVSGAVGSKGTSERGTSVFGGDLVSSGTIYSNKIISSALSGSLTHLSDGSSYLVAGSNVTIATGSSGAVTISASSGGSGEWTDGGDFIYPSDGGGESVVIGGNSVGTADIYLKSDGAAIFNEQGAAVDFRVESDSKTHAIFVDGTNDFVEIGAGGAAFTSQDVSIHLSGTIGTSDSPDSAVLVSGDLVVSGAIFGGTSHDSTERELGLVSQVVTVGSHRGEEFGEDVSFFVSGSKSGNDKGKALFGGDLVSSGTILPGADLGSNLGAPTRRFGNIYTGDLHLRNDRGDWTIVEEADYLCVVNNLTGKKFKMALIPLDEE